MEYDLHTDSELTDSKSSSGKILNLNLHLVLRKTDRDFNFPDAQYSWNKVKRNKVRGIIFIILHYFKRTDYSIRHQVLITQAIC